MTQIGYYSRPFWPVYEPRTYLSSSYSGNLGLRGADGARGQGRAPGPRRWCRVTGDGGFLYNAQELSTAARARDQRGRVVFNDSAYGNVARDLDESWGGSTAPSSPTPTS